MVEEEVEEEEEEEVGAEERVLEDMEEDVVTAGAEGTGGATGEEGKGGGKGAGQGKGKGLKKDQKKGKKGRGKGGKQQEQERGPRTVLVEHEVLRLPETLPLCLAGALDCLGRRVKIEIKGEWVWGTVAKYNIRQQTHWVTFDQHQDSRRRSGSSPPVGLKRFWDLRREYVRRERRGRDVFVWVGVWVVSGDLMERIFTSSFRHFSVSHSTFSLPRSCSLVRFRYCALVGPARWVTMKGFGTLPAFTVHYSAAYPEE